MFLDSALPGRHIGSSLGRMAEEDRGQTTLPREKQRIPLPQGYRQGIITAITVLLGFSLTFFRYWGFEASGEWTFHSAIPAGTLIVAIVLQIIALFRSLRIADDDVIEYRTTVMWFIVSAVVLLISLSIAVLVFPSVLDPIRTSRPGPGANPEPARAASARP